MIAACSAGQPGKPSRASAKRKSSSSSAEGVEDALDQHHLRLAELAPLAGAVDARPEQVHVLTVPVDDRDAAEAGAGELADHIGDHRDQRLGPQRGRPREALAAAGERPAARAEDLRRGDHQVELGGEEERELVRDQGVDAERQVRPVLLGRPDRPERDRAAGRRGLDLGPGHLRHQRRAGHPVSVELFLISAIEG